MSLKEIFQPIDVPKAYRELAISRSAEWYTWSSAFRRCVHNLRGWFQDLPEPRLIRIPGLVEYNQTFALPSPFPERLSPFVCSLCSIRRSGRIRLLADLLDANLDGNVLHRLFALMRGGIAEKLGDQRSCLYTPLGKTGRNAGDFALHADLYVPEFLFNVFEEVPADPSGASTFLAVKELRRLLQTLETVPTKVRTGILQCFDSALTQDGFHRLFDLLHESGKPWSDELDGAMRERQLKIRLDSGEGYLIHDRTWLHGREAPTGGVPRRRVHRLIFNTLAIQRRMRKGSSLTS